VIGGNAELRKVLVIAYFFPPYAGVGAHRSSQIVRNLREFGYEPIVLTTARGTFARDPLRPVGEDEDSLKRVPPDVKVYRSPAFQPFRLIGLLSRMKLMWLYHWFARPDEKVTWCLPAIIKGLRIARRHKVDLIYSLPAGAFSTAFVGVALKWLLRKPLIIDMQDPFTQWPMGVWPTRLHYHLDRLIERIVLGAADSINMVWETYRDELIASQPSLASKRITWIHNGFDPEETERMRREAGRPRRDDPGIMTVMHSGVFYDRWGKLDPADRPSVLKRLYRATIGRLRYKPLDVDYEVHSPRLLMRAMSELKRERPEIGRNIRFNLTGNSDPGIARLAKELDIEDQVNLLGFVSRREYLQQLFGAELRLLPMSRFRNGRKMGWLVLKMYDYLQTCAPILVLSDDSTTRDICLRAGTGIAVKPDDLEEMKTTLIRLYEQHRSGGVRVKPDREYLRRFEWRNVVKRVAELCDETLEHSTRRGAAG